jgi:hypothetical protein
MLNMFKSKPVRPGALPIFEKASNLLKLPPKSGANPNTPTMEAPVGDIMENMGKQAAEQAEKMQQQVVEYYKMITSSNKILLRFILVVGIIIVFLIIVFYISGRNNKMGNNATLLKQNIKDYVKFKDDNDIGSISNFNFNASYDKVHKRPSSLKDYYILGSYNSCCGGEVFNNWVDIKILENTIELEPRVLDFEIFSLNGVPIVAASLKNASSKAENAYSKDTLNHLEIPTVLESCKKALYGINTQNANDFLILNFRIKTHNTAALNALAQNIKDAFKASLLSEDYGSGGRNKNVVNEKMKFLNQKVIISVYDHTNLFKETDLYKITNICNNMENKDMGGVEFLRNYDVQYETDKEDAIKKNKLTLKIVIPDETNESENPPHKIHRDNGCQISLMRFNVYDSNLKEALGYFSNNGSAIVMKPDNYRYKPIILPAPKKMDPRVKKILEENS